jgi:hypothetical protein
MNYLIKKTKPFGRDAMPCVSKKSPIGKKISFVVGDPASRWSQSQNKKITIGEIYQWNIFYTYEYWTNNLIDA